MSTLRTSEYRVATQPPNGSANRTGPTSCAWKAKISSTDMATGCYLAAATAWKKRTQDAPTARRNSAIMCGWS